MFLKDAAPGVETVLDIYELQRQAREGDKAAEDLLFQTLTARFRLFAKRSIWNDDDCREVVQETVVTILEKYKSIDFKTSFIGWAHNILKNKILNHVTKAGRHSDLLSKQFAGNKQESAYNPEPEFEKKLLDCFGKISRKNNRYARAINLSYQGFTAREICEKMKLTVNNFYSVLSRARAMLLECLENG